LTAQARIEEDESGILALRVALGWGVGVLVVGITAALVTLTAGRERQVLTQRTAAS
jgi:hypothetical protein